MCSKRDIYIYTYIYIYIKTLNSLVTVLYSKLPPPSEGLKPHPPPPTPLVLQAWLGFIRFHLGHNLVAERKLERPLPPSPLLDPGLYCSASRLPDLVAEGWLIPLPSQHKKKRWRFAPTPVLILSQ